MPIDNQPLPGIKPGSDQGQTTVVTPPVPLKNPSKDKLKLQKVPKKLKDIVDISPTIKEEDKKKSKHSVMAFGRMNPPHAGHQHVVDKVADVAKKVGAKRGRVVVSHSHDKEKNPLDQKSRMDYVKKMNPSNKVRGSSKEHPNFLSYAKKLHGKGTTDLHVVTGSDRADNFKKTLDKYNNHPDHYSFNSITVHKAGEDRDEKSKSTSGASGTKQREHAKKGDYKSFAKNLPKALQKDGESMYKKMREWNEGDWDDLIQEWNDLSDDQLELMIDNDIETENVINERVLNLMQRKRAALKMRRLKFRIARARKIKRKRFATMDMLTRRARRKARQFIRKRIAGKMGEKYVDLSPSQKMSIDRRMQKKIPFINKMAKRLLPKVRQAELVRLKAARARKESYINSSFGSLITELQTSGSPDDYGIEQLKESGDYTPTAITETSDPKLRIKESQQAEIKQEAHYVSEAVDVMVDALAALDKKAQKANVELDTLFVEFIDGYNNPHGKQTPQQGGFAAVNRLLAEMSAAEKDKAEDIVKGMKKKASYFMKKYGKDAKSVMYATANKMAQEDMQKFRKEIIEGELEEGGWEGWERFNKSSKGKKMRKRVSKNRKRGDHKAYQFDKWGNVIDDSIGEGTIAQTFDKKAIDKYMSKKKPAKQKPEDEKKKIARAYGIKNEGMFDDLGLKAKAALHPSERVRRRSSVKVRVNDKLRKQKERHKKQLDRMNSGKSVNEAFDDLIKQAKDKSNRVKDAEMVNKMKKVAFRHRKVDEGMGAAYMPDTDEKKTAGREITSKAVLKQLNRNRNRGAMKGKVRTPNVRYLHDRDRETDLTAAQRGKTVINPEEKKKGKGHRKKKGKKSKK